MAYSEAQNRASQKYRAKVYKRVPLDLRKEDYADLQAHVSSRGGSVNGFTKRAIRETMARDRGDNVADL